ncbi:MAG: hypothetical protein JOZ29_18420 [Deltaproteobacteria bacterium]|nr:hypothetical protein [Deltaproteobacteria bacterium]
MFTGLSGMMQILPFSTHHAVSFFLFRKALRGMALRIMAIHKPHFAFLNTCFSDVGWITFALLTIIADVDYGMDKIEIKQRLA